MKLSNFFFLPKQRFQDAKCPQDWYLRMWNYKTRSGLKEIGFRIFGWTFIIDNKDEIHNTKKD